MFQLSGFYYRLLRPKRLWTQTIDFSPKTKLSPTTLDYQNLNS